MKLFWLTGLVSAFGAFTLQGCGDDSEDGGTGGSAGATGGATAKGGSGGSGGGSGGSSAGNTSKGGSAGASTGGTGQGGEPTGGGGEPTGGGGDPTGGGGMGNEPSEDCLEFCTGQDSISNVCGDEEFFPAEWEGAGCLTECAGFEGAALTCWNMHRGFAAGETEPGPITMHCGHATGQPGNGQCAEL